MILMTQSLHSFCCLHSGSLLLRTALTIITFNRRLVPFVITHNNRVATLDIVVLYKIYN